MGLIGNAIEYVKDIKYANSLYPSGWSRPDVVKGFFVGNELGSYQKAFFEELLDYGFKRTHWQLVFPKQTAGLVRKLEPKKGNELHVRFYEDGVISSELEYSRLSIKHWRGERQPATNMLEEILDKEISSASPQLKEKIKEQFAERHYGCVRPAQEKTELIPDSVKDAIATGFLAVQYPLTVAGAVYMFSKGHFYYALEPAFLAAIETPLFLGAILGKSK